MEIEIKMIKVREAHSLDCPAIFELVKELALFEKAPHEVSVTIEEMMEAGFGVRPVWKAFVAEEDGRIIGFALYYIRYSTWKGNRMYLEDLLVTEKKRGLGIGKILFDAIIQECKDKGFKGIVWQVLDWNTPAINFYNKYSAHLDEEWINCSLSEEQILMLSK